MLLYRLIQQFGFAQSSRLTSAVALCVSLAAGCGGHTIPIGGEPIDTDDSDTSNDTTTQDTTKPDESDGDQTSDGTDDSHDTSGDDTSGATTPSGVYCEQYEPCGVNKPCEAGECISFPECGSAICIPPEDACKLSCPVAEECAILESYPAQLACEGKVPAIPGKPGTVDECTTEGGTCLPPDQAAPPSYVVGNFVCAEPDYRCWVPASSEPSEPGGVSCDAHKPCDVETACGQGETCIDFPEIGMALCIGVEEACKFSCPDPTSCVIAESYPGHLSCPDRIDATCSAGGGTTGDAGAPEGVKCEEHETCDALDPCDEGSCIKVPGCEAPLCIDAALACKQACGQVDCAIAESYPEQLFCNDDSDDPSDDPDQPVSSNDAGASAPGFPGLDAGPANDASSE